MISIDLIGVLSAAELRAERERARWARGPDCCADGMCGGCPRCGVPREPPEEDVP